jgi:hypothetical protein
VRDVFLFYYFCALSTHTCATYLHKCTNKIVCNKQIYFSLLYSVIDRDFSSAVEFLDANRIPIDKALLIT